jgi:hypothetical protein
MRNKSTVERLGVRSSVGRSAATVWAATVWAATLLMALSRRSWGKSRERMTEIFRIYDGEQSACPSLGFVLFFKTFPRAEAIEK